MITEARATQPALQGQSGADTASATRAIRVLHVVPLPPPWTGIGVSVDQLLSSEPIQAQVNMIVNTSPGRVTPGGPKKVTARRMLRHVSLAAHVARSVKQHQIEVVHLHGSGHDLSFVGNWLTLRAAAAAGARTIWQIHEDLNVVKFPGRGRLTRTTFAALASRVDLLAVMTTKDRAVAGRLIDERRIVVIPETCNPEMLGVPLERRDGDLRVLYVGWLSYDKGIYDLIDVADQTRRSLPGVVFDVLGTARSDEENAGLHRIVQERGLEGTVRLHGVKSGRDKYDMFAQAHALFMPTHWDAFPVTVLEGMAAGLPVLGSRVGGLPFMLEEGTGGFLEPSGAIAAMSDVLVRLGRDPELRARMGAANRARYLATYQPNIVGQMAVDVYRRLAGRRPEVPVAAGE